MTRMKLAYIHEYADRHGKVRRYVRRPGCPRVSLPGLPGSPEFMAAYQAAMAGPTVQVAAPSDAGTVRALVTDFYRSAEFANLKPSSQRLYRLILEKFATQDGHRLVKTLPPEAARKIIGEVGQDRPGMANLTRSVLLRLMSFAIALGRRADNPFLGVTPYRLGSRHTWSESELLAYERRWPVGTRERLAFDALLYTGQRVGDVVRMLRPDSRAREIRLVQQKTGAELVIAIHPALSRSIAKTPKLGVYLLGSERDGRPIDTQTLSALVKAAARASGLPRECLPHGLRKAALRRLAEHGSTDKQIAAVSGHRSLKEVERYTAAADQARLARQAIGKLPGGRRHRD